jgi:hypothetical protein
MEKKFNTAISNIAFESVFLLTRVDWFLPPRLVNSSIFNFGGVADILNKRNL